MIEKRSIQTLLLVVILILMTQTILIQIKYASSLSLDNYYHFSQKNSQKLIFKELGHLYTGDYSWDVQVVDNICYIADQGNGLKIIDVEDPLNPIEIGHFKEGMGGPHAIVTDGKTLYMPDWVDGLEILNVTDPTNPQKLGQYRDEGQSYDVALNDDLAYVAHEEWGLLILNISDTTNPVKLGQFHDGGAILRVFFHNNIVYASDLQEGLELINVSDATHPNKIITFEEYTGVETIINNIAYAGTSDGDGVILNFTDIYNPREISRLSGYEYISKILIIDNICYLAAMSDGIIVIDIENKMNPKEMGRFTNDEPCMGIFVLDDLIYATFRNEGLIILQMISNIKSTITTSSTDSLISSTTPGIHLSLLITILFVLILIRKTEQRDRR